jgi:FkbM family methyltransferase
MISPTTILTIVDGVQIVVPDSLELITPYVLREQQDWFEDEIKFLRRLLKPGYKVMDIGANYGVYTLSMAQAVGPSGRVWAFEPASSTASLLTEGIAANGFAHVTFERTALSSTRGTAQLSLNLNSELNALVHDNLSTSDSETVPVVTLDDCLETYDWRNIDFMKIDAEGEEANILKGGERFFAELSPLVQYEVKAGSGLHMELVQAFASIGYDSYRLVPGLDLLIPFEAETQPDGYLLNLFCCKPDRVAQLAAQGFLLNPVDLRKGAEWFKDRSKKSGSRNVYDWRNTLVKLPYGAELANLWEQTMAAGQSGVVDKALSFYAASRDSSLSPAERFYALAGSFIRFSFLCEREPSHLRLASLARVARDYGARSISVNALVQLSNTIFQNNQLDPSEPFLAPCERFDFVPSGEVLANWVLSAVLEELERSGSFSSFYTGDSSRQRLEIIRDLGFGSAEMERRLMLVQQRFSLPRK